MASAAQRFPHNTPSSKEAYFIREVFHEHFGSDAAARTVLKWIPKWQANQDPSGRANQVHQKALCKHSKQLEVDQEETTKIGA